MNLFSPQMQSQTIEAENPLKKFKNYYFNKMNNHQNTIDRGWASEPLKLNIIWSIE